MLLPFLSYIPFPLSLWLSTPKGGLFIHLILKSLFNFQVPFSPSPPPPPLLAWSLPVNQSKYRHLVAAPTALIPIQQKKEKPIAVYTLDLTKKALILSHIHAFLMTAWFAHGLDHIASTGHHHVKRKHREYGGCARWDYFAKTKRKKIRESL